MISSSFKSLLSMIRPDVTYESTVIRIPVLPEERLAVTLR
jgi:hypothetical protein